MHQNCWRLGLCPRPRWRSLHTIDEIHDTVHKIIAPDASISVQKAAKSLAAGAPPQTPLGELTYTIDEIHDTLLRIIAPDASIYVQNAPKSLAAGAPPQTPLGSLQRSPRPPSC